MQDSSVHNCAGAPGRREMLAAWGVVVFLTPRVGISAEVDRDVFV